MISASRRRTSVAPSGGAHPSRRGCERKRLIAAASAASRRQAAWRTGAARSPTHPNGFFTSPMRRTLVQHDQAQTDGPLTRADRLTDGRDVEDCGTRHDQTEIHELIAIITSFGPHRVTIKVASVCDRRPAGRTASRPSSQTGRRRLGANVPTADWKRVHVRSSPADPLCRAARAGLTETVTTRPALARNYGHSFHAGDLLHRDVVVPQVLRKNAVKSQMLEIVDTFLAKFVIVSNSELLSGLRFRPQRPDK